jgi:hypothetical protein
MSLLNTFCSVYSCTFLIFTNYILKIEFDTINSKLNNIYDENIKLREQLNKTIIDKNIKPI